MKNLKDYSKEEFDILEVTFRRRITNTQRFCLLKDIGFIDSMQDYYGLKKQLYDKIVLERKKQEDIFANMETFNFPKNTDCVHKYYRVEPHQNDDVGAWFSCMKCGLFAYVKK